MTRNTLFTTLFMAATLLCGGCSSDDDKDTTKPVISTEGITPNPINCQTYAPGDTIPFQYLFTDDTELGSYNIEIHSNFDHHSHSTESSEEEECQDEHEHHEENQGSSVAWTYNKSFDIPAGQTRFTARQDIAIPANAAHGHYHFMIRLTDKAGWQQLRAIAITIDAD